MLRLIMTAAIVTMFAANAFAAMVPGFVNAPLKKFVNDLAGQGYKVRVEQGSPAGSIKEIGFVESVSPTGRVPLSTVITVKGYSATRPVVMSNLVDYKQAEAEKFFNDHGIPYKVVYQFNKCKIGFVAAHAPRFGEMYSPGNQVQLSVCAHGFALPNYVGQRERDLDRHPVVKFQKTGQVGISSKIVRQDPPAGTIVPAGSNVKLEFVSEAVVVPNFIGIDPFSLQKEIDLQMLKIEIIGQRKGKVIKQSIAQGTKVPWGSKITLEMK